MTSLSQIAVVGMGGIFPGADDLDQYWRHILDRHVATTRIPADRWAAPVDTVLAETPQPDRALTRIAGLVTSPPPLPPDLPIEPSLLATLDPLYTMVVSAGWHAYNACRRDRLDPDRVGVVLAALALPTAASAGLAAQVVLPSVAGRLFGSGARRPPPAEAASLGARVTGLPGGVLATALGLGGGSLTLDAACASSLYAVKLACDALQEGRVDAMLAGGVSRPDCLYTQIGFSQLRALSPSGVCAPFDRGADGLVVGEGAGIVVLKRLEDAISHGDTVWGVIRGMGLSNDVEGNLLAPSSEGQLRAMRSAYQAAGWEPQSVQLIECHGAGTPVGDAVEIQSLLRLWGPGSWQAGQCTLGSVKSNIGHLLTAAGAAGMLKTLLALHHGLLPPTAGFRAFGDPEMNQGPFQVRTAPAPWPDTRGSWRRAAVSAFGFGGINAHLLLDAPGDRTAAGGPLPTAAKRSVHAQSAARALCDPVAVVGMGAALGPLATLADFGSAVMGADPATGQRPRHRWGLLGERLDHLPAAMADLSGAFMGNLELDIGPYRLPPREAPDVLTQQLLMLDVANTAMADAGQPSGKTSNRHAAVIGIDFDFEATDFTLRWHLDRQMRRWQSEGLLAKDLPAAEAAAWLARLKDALSPPLTPSRTLGALGSIVASRIAREFHFGGPSFTVSAGAASGLKALDIATGLLHRGEAELALVGAVDLAGDPRQVALDCAWLPARHPLPAAPTIAAAADHRVGEGAAAVVLKPLARAQADGDRIYAVITGTGSANTAGSRMRGCDAAAYTRSLNTCLEPVQTHLEQVALFETQVGGDTGLDTVEAGILRSVFPSPGPLVAALPALVGRCGAATGLAALVRMAICLQQGRIPATARALDPTSATTAATIPLKGCVAAVTRYGDVTHILLEAPPAAVPRAIAGPAAARNRRPSGRA
jgi:acyl transferase domain-containing protein